MTEEYRVDDLARRAGVSVRNVRVYQDRGLLPPPRREGRTGWYSTDHLTRLELIGRMLDRGYTFATISELLTAAQYGMRVEDVLSAEEPHGPGTKFKQPTRLGRADFEAMFGDDVADADLERGVQLGVTAREGDGYRVDNPVLLEAARVLADAGISLSDTLDQTEGVRRDLGDVARRFVELVTDRYMPQHTDPFELDAGTVADVAELVNRLRPLAHQAVNALFEEAMNTQITLTMERIVEQFGDKPGSQSDQAS